MSTPSVSSEGGSPLSVTGLASGLNTSAIISALLAAERQPITRLTNQQEKLQAQQQKLQSIQSSLQSLSFAVSEFSLPSLYDGTQTVSSSEPLRISAATTSGAGVGGYEVEVTQLANSAQRTYTFKSPAAEDTLTIDGRQYKVKAGGEAKELAGAINSDSSATVYAAVLDNETIVLSNRATGATTGEFITVADPGGTITEKAGTAKEGKNAEFKVDGVAGTATSNTVTTAIPGVTLTLEGLTTTGPVTVTVQPPGMSVSTIEGQMQAFVTQYNKTVEAIAKELSTKPLPNPQNASDLAVGSLFGDHDLSSLLNRMRQAMYEPIAGLPAEMSSPADVGLSTGVPSGGASTSQATLEGQLKLDPAKLASAIQSNPAGAKQMLEHWSQNLQGLLTTAAQPGGTIDTRVSGENNQITELKGRIVTMNEMLAVRQKALEQTYAQLEGIISHNTAQSNWLAGQAEQLTKSGL